MANDKKSQVHCLECSRETNHETLARHKVSGEDDQYGIQWQVDYSIIRCCGCDEVSFMKVSGSSEDFDPETGEYCPSTSLYPDRASGRSMLASAHEFPPRIRSIYREVIGAMNSSSPLLAAIGLRALIEAICVAEKTKGKDLEKRIDQLATDGHLSANQAAMLHSHRFLGNTAAHEITAPKPKELIAALDIAETLLKTIYVLPTLGDSITTGKKS